LVVFAIQLPPVAAVFCGNPNAYSFTCAHRLVRNATPCHDEHLKTIAVTVDVGITARLWLRMQKTCFSTGVEENMKRLRAKLVVPTGDVASPSSYQETRTQFGGEAGAMFNLLWELRTAAAGIGFESKRCRSIYNSGANGNTRDIQLLKSRPRTSSFAYIFDGNLV
jgi:hypothetical protein